MASTSTRTIRRDAGASVFAFALAGVALLLQVVTTVTEHWWADELTLQVTRTDGTGSAALLVDAADVPDWAVAVLRAADVVEWLAGGAVLVLLSACVVWMIRGEIFTRRTARWITGASWATLLLLLGPSILRAISTNVAIHAADDPDRWDSTTITVEFWYLYVGMMTLSFFALVVRRGAQLQADQDGLI